MMRKREKPDTSATYVRKEINLDTDTTSIGLEQLKDVKLPVVTVLPCGEQYPQVEDLRDIMTYYRRMQRFNGLPPHYIVKNLVMPPWCVRAVCLRDDDPLQVRREYDIQNYLDSRWGNLQEVGVWPTDDPADMRAALERIINSYLINPSLHTIAGR